MTLILASYFLYKSMFLHIFSFFRCFLIAFVTTLKLTLLSGSALQECFLNSAMRPGERKFHTGEEWINYFDKLFSSVWFNLLFIYLNGYHLLTHLKTKWCNNHCSDQEKLMPDLTRKGGTHCHLVWVDYEIMHVARAQSISLWVGLMWRFS